MMVHRGHLILAVSLAVPLVLAGCGGKVRISSAKLCQAHGGTYNVSAKTCAPPPDSTTSAKQACDRMGGYYDSFADHCEVGQD